MGLRQFIVSRLAPSLNLPCRLTNAKGERLSHIDIGNLGERIAYRALQAQGAKPFYRNYRGPKGGEVDILVRDRKILAFVEVKTRTYRSETSRPMDAVDHKKRQYIKRGAHAWLKLLPDNDFVWRYDVVEVILEEGKVPDVNWVKAAFREDD